MASPSSPQSSPPALPADTTEIPGSRFSLPPYSPAQLQAYFERISLPAKHLASPIFKCSSLARSYAHGMPILAALVCHHQAEVPFETLNAHCYPSPRYKTDLLQIYQSIVTDGRGRGGPCTVQNSLLGNVLRSLGFEVIETAARVNTACQAIASTPGYKGPSYNCWDHKVLMVVLSGQRYLVDVGMGARGPVIILPLQHCATVVSIAPRRARLLHGCLPEHSRNESTNLLWCLETQQQEGSLWIPVYAFGEMEFLPEDFDALAYYCFTNPRSWMVHNLVAIRFILDSATEELIGDVSLSGTKLKRTIRGKVDHEEHCHTYRERVEVLRKHFGIELTQDEDKFLGQFVAKTMAPKL